MPVTAYSLWILCGNLLDGYLRTKVELSIGGETFHCTGQRVTEKGFTAIMPWSAVDEKKLPSFLKGEKIEVLRVELYEVTFFLQYLLLLSLPCTS